MEIKPPTTKDIGFKSEQFVVDCLTKVGFNIIERNYTMHRYGEIDIIGVFKNSIYFVEVRSRHAGSHTPEESLTSFKKRKTTRVIKSYLKFNNAYESYEKKMIFAAVTYSSKTSDVKVKFYFI